MYLVQAVGTIMAAFVEVGVKHWIFDNVHDICSVTQKDDLVCPHNQVFFTASAVWYAIPYCYEDVDILTGIQHFQGTYWARPTIWERRLIPSPALRSHHWSIPAHSLLVMAAALPNFVG
jgi:hypothetical protein